MQGQEKNRYTVSYLPQPDWSRVPAAELRHTGWLEPCAVRAWAQVCHDGENLWVRMEAEEAPVRATLTGKLDQVCDDSCLEFFFAPLAEDKRYFNFEFNPLGTLNLGFGAERPTRVRQIVKQPTVGIDAFFAHVNDIRMLLQLSDSLLETRAKLPRQLFRQSRHAQQKRIAVRVHQQLHSQ